MSKQKFENGKMIIIPDLENPEDYVKVKRKEMKDKGKKLGSLKQVEKDELLLMLCKLHGIELE